MNLNQSVLTHRSKQELILLLHASCGYLRALRQAGIERSNPLYGDASIFNMEVQRHLRERFNCSPDIWWAINERIYHAQAN